MQVNQETGKFSLCLKQSVSFSTDASLIYGYFLEEEKVSQDEVQNSFAWIVTLFWRTILLSGLSRYDSAWLLLASCTLLVTPTDLFRNLSWISGVEYLIFLVRGRSQIIWCFSQIVEASGASNLEWTENLAVGTCIDGEIQEIKDYGVIVNVQNHKDVVGFVTHYQCKHLFTFCQASQHVGSKQGWMQEAQYYRTAFHYDFLLLITVGSHRDCCPPCGEYQKV